MEVGEGCGLHSGVILKSQCSSPPLTKSKVQEGTSGPDHQHQMGGIPGDPLVHPSTSGTCSRCGDMGTETGEMEEHANDHSAK